MECGKDLIIQRFVIMELVELLLFFACEFFFTVFQLFDLDRIIERRQGFVCKHGFDALFVDGVAALKWLHNGVLAINELGVRIDLAVFILFEIGIELGDGCAIFWADLITFVTKGFAELVTERRAIDELDLAFAFCSFVLGEDPDVGGDAGIIEEIGWQCDDGFDEVVFKHPPPDLTFARSSAAREEWTAVFNDGSATELVVHFVDGRLEEEHLHVTRAWEPCAPTTVEPFEVFVFDGLFNTFCCILAAPGSTEWWVFQDETHFDVWEAVSFHGVLIADILGVLPFDKHFGKADGVRFRVHFLTKETHVRCWVVALNEIIPGGEHPASAAGLVKDRDNLTVVEDVIATFREKDIDHELDDVSAGVVIASFGIFRESADQVFEDVAHLDVIDRLWVEVQFRESLHNREKTVVLVHLVDLFTEVETTFFGDQDLKHIRREPLQVALEVVPPDDPHR